MTDQMQKEKQEEVQRLKNEFAKCGVCPRYEFTREEIMLDMEDGVSLQTIVYKPRKEGLIPTVVVRTCYPDNDLIYRAQAEEYAGRGFAFVYQYCRGTGKSEGVWEPNVNERKDGKKTIDWICKKDWVGNTGYFGCSYLALTGWIIADILPDKVKTMYLTHYGTFRFVSAYKDGMFRHDVLTAWTMENAGYPITADYLKSCRFLPQVEVDEKLWGKAIPWYRQWITSTNATDDYWNTGVWGLLKDIPSRVKIPLYIGEGWYDHHLGSAIETYKALSDEAKKHSRFLIGAWDHGFNVKVQDRAGSNFENNDTLRAFNWFQDILVDEKMPEGSIDWYVIGADKWNIRKTYQIAEKEEIRFNIVSKSKAGYYGLSTVKQNSEDFLSYDYDPQNPVLTHGAESCLHTKKEQGSLRQKEPNYRKDLVSCVSEPVAHDITVMGNIRIKLTVSTDADDSAYVVKVMEVFPDGKTYNMRTGITTLGYRNGAQSRMTYNANSKTEVVIDTWDLAWKIKKGSRIRIDIASSDFPQYSIHSNYAGCWAKQDKTRIAHQKIYFGGNNSSYVSFPTISE